VITAETVRGWVPLPVIKSHGLGLLLGVVLLTAGFAWTYDAFNGQGRQVAFPFGAILPF
jgi:hypothetical protein